ncbi:hypothetical protein Caci_7765 [Catenulispora acidiphila DSM 44928]|uniref:DUF4328 domain-containing protein n=1 Tax=Catenulispora acidiphila (strain DSM 44928 / JCM 14897 / NBRC 102108 / NRRL B-24433 / ID139908) TaxID=479433 RepID=C7QE01_CATAD|nr:DUF4328 domain-containing protein [Catenulispora acidiphila]ACU76589.1 hypothetical protein Caci_7765 [Catenulispora acidiphila DSM 44928]
MPGVTGSPISPYGYPAPYGANVPRIRTSVQSLGTAVTVLLALDAALAVLAAGLLAWRNTLIGDFLGDPASVDPDRMNTADQAAGSATGWFIILTVATAVVFICWFWAARNNAEVYAPNRGSLPTGWAIGGWFIPLAGLVMPGIVARDIHRGTMAGRDNTRATGGMITGWWWSSYVAFWIMCVVVSVQNGRARNAADPLEHLHDVRSASEAGIIALSVGVAAALLAITYVQTITRAQRARIREAGWYAPGQPWAYGMPYGYGAPMPGYPMGMPVPMPMPGPGQPPMPAGPPAFGMPVAMPMPGQPPMPTGSDAFGMPVAMPMQDVPVQNPIPAAHPQTAETQTAETQTADVQPTEPPKEPGDWPNPPN